MKHLIHWKSREQGAREEGGMGQVVWGRLWGVGKGHVGGGAGWEEVGHVLCH